MSAAMAITGNRFYEMVSKAVAVAVAALHAQGGGGNGGGGGAGGQVLKGKACSDVRKFDKGDNLCGRNGRPTLKSPSAPKAWR